MSVSRQLAPRGDVPVDKGLPLVTIPPGAPDVAQHLVTAGPQSSTPTAEKQLFHSVAARAGLTPPDAADTVQFVRLFRAIQHATGNRLGAIVQFVGCSAGGSSALLAYQTSCIGATLLGKRLLFIDATDDSDEALATSDAPQSKQLYDVALGEAEIDDVIGKQSGAGICVTTLHPGKFATNRMLGARQIELVLEALRNSFDCIIIASPPALEQPLSAVLTVLVDGSVLILDTEKTRSDAAVQSVQLLTSGGGRIIGAVMNQSRQHAPWWMRRWL